MAQTLLDTDNFGGTNGTALPTYNANWNTHTGFGDANIAGTPGISGSGGGNYRTGQTWTNNQWCELTIDGTTRPDEYCYVMVRAQVGSKAMYYCGTEFVTYADYNYRFWRADGGSAVFAMNLGQAQAAGDTINLEIDGTVLNFRVNGVSLLTYDTTTGNDGGAPGTPDSVQYASGNPGLVCSHSSNTTRVAGAWRAGSITSGGPTVTWVGYIG